MSNLYDCPPWQGIPRAGEPRTILQLASQANAAADWYRRTMDERAPFKDVLSAAGHLARITSELTSAIADSVAEGNNALDIIE